MFCHFCGCGAPRHTGICRHGVCPACNVQCCRRRHISSMISQPGSSLPCCRIAICFRYGGQGNMELRDWAQRDRTNWQQAKECAGWHTLMSDSSGAVVGLMAIDRWWCYRGGEHSAGQTTGNLHHIRLHHSTTNIRFGVQTADVNAPGWAEHQLRGGPGQMLARRRTACESDFDSTAWTMG